MDARGFWRGVAALLLLPASACTTAPTDPQSAAPAEPAAVEAQQALGVYVDRWCDAPGCEISLEFDAPMVPADRLEGAPPPAALTLEPELPGRWAWRSPTTLVFTPSAEDKALWWGHSATVKLTQATAVDGRVLARPFEQLVRAPYLSVGYKVASWPVIEGRPRALGVLRGDEGDLLVGPMPILVAYDQPLKVDQLAPHVQVLDARGLPLPVRIAAGEEAADRFGVGGADPTHHLSIALKTLPAHGSHVWLSYPSWSEPAEAPRILNRKLEVVAGLQLLEWTLQGRVQSEGEVPLAHTSATVRVRLSSPVSAAEVEGHLVVEPKPKAVSVYTTPWSRTATVELGLEAGTRYDLRLDPGIIDRLGNRMGPSEGFALRTRDLPPSLQLASTGVIERGGRLPLRAVNVAGVKLGLTPLDGPEAFLRAKQDGCPAIWERGRRQAVALPADAALNERVELAVPVLPRSGSFFCVHAEGEGLGSEKLNGSKRAVGPVMVTDVGATVKVEPGALWVWATRLRDAAPLARAAVEVRDASGTPLAKGRTDADGVVRLPTELATRGGLSAPVDVVVAKGREALVLRLDGARLSEPWQFGLRGGRSGADVLPASVFTDRGVYRPGETVRAKLLVREPGSFQPPEAGASAKVRVVDPRGKSVLQRELALDAFGAADTDLALPAHAAIGAYELSVSHGDQRARASFRVEAYRVPSFQVEVRGEALEAGRAGRASLRARYLHGGKLAGRRVSWRVTREPASVQAVGLEGYVFRAAGVEPAVEQVEGGEGRLDGQGHLAVDFPVSPPAEGPSRYVVDATVTDVDRQAWRGTLSQLVHPTDYYVGVAVPRGRAIEKGAAIEVPVVAVGPGGEMIAGRDVEVALQRVDHLTQVVETAQGAGALENHELPETEASCRVVTGQAPKACSLRPKRVGAYRVVARSVDDRGRAAIAGFELSVGGAGLAAWPRFDHERITVRTDKASYAPGEVAKLMVESPFARARGWLVLERDGVLEHRGFEIRGDTPILEVPVSAEMAPNVYASVVLLRGREHEERDASGFETGAPAFRMGYANLSVKPSEAELRVMIRPDSETAAPGEALRVELEVRDRAGGLAEGQATVFVVDEAVLGLTGYETPAPLESVFAKRALAVRTGESRLDLPHSRRARREALFVGGDGGELSTRVGGRRSRRRSEVPAPEARGRFESTALWSPRVEIREGRAVVELTLPDNLTTWRVMAVVAGEGVGLGQAEASVEVRKPLMVQPVAPRFVFEGDQLKVGARLYNSTEEAEEVLVQLSAEGLEVEGAAARKVWIPAQGSALVEVPVRVSARGGQEVALQLNARMGADRDAVRIALPVSDRGTRERLVVSRQIPASDAGELQVALPSERLPGTTELEVRVSTTALSELGDAVSYLMQYPHGCLEQTTSRAYPLVMLEDLLPAMGVEVDAGELRKMAEAGVKRLLSFQTSAGGLSYWHGKDEAHAFGTAFGLSALIEAKKRGYEVPDDALAAMADYLEKVLRKGAISEEMPHGGMADADTRAFLVMTLGRLGRPQPAYVETLWRERDKLTPFGLSFLAVAVEEGRASKTLLDPILAEVRRAAKEASDEAWYEGERGRGWSMGSPLRTHAGALLAYARGGGSSMAPKLLRGLLKRRQGGLWGNTQENVFGIMGIATLVGRRGGEAPHLSVAVQDREVPTSKMEPMGDQGYRLKVRGGELGVGTSGAEAPRVRVSSGDKPSFVSVRASWERELGPQDREPQAEGLGIERRYEALSGEALGGAVSLGQLVRVRLRVEAERGLHYVAVTDHLPAGLEPLNANLKTTEQVERGPLSEALARGLERLSYSEMRDGSVSFYMDDLPRGTYEVVYVARATTAGRFHQPAATAEAMYDPETWGRTGVGEVRVR